MKIVQSFWSKPYHSRDLFFLNSGGWSHRTFNYMSWALSCLRFKKFYKIELITDTLGKELLIDTLELPYDNVSLKLDELNDKYHNHKNIWALGKIYAFEIQEEPFIHADADVFIWDRFPSRIENGELIAQQIEQDSGYHEGNLIELYSRLEYIPDVIQSYYSKTGDASQYNAGIIGGNNFSFFQEYAKLAREIVDKNFDVIGNVDFSINKNAFPCFFEQYLFLCMAREKNIDVKVLIDNIKPKEHIFQELINFHNAHRTHYIHLLGAYKLAYNNAKMVSYYLWKEFPYYYKKITNLMKENKI